MDRTFRVPVLQTGFLLFSLLPSCCRYTEALLTSPFSSHLHAHRTLPLPRTVKCCMEEGPRPWVEVIDSQKIPRLQSNEQDSVLITRLKVQLQDAVAAEDYSSAAALQAQLRTTQTRLTKLQFDTDKGELVAIQSPNIVVRAETNEVKSVLADDERRRNDESDDVLFYAKPRMALHADLSFALRLQELYTKRLSSASSILDLGASCATFLPENLNCERVVGLGMNMEEMLANEDLTDRIVHDLNQRPTLPFPDNAFDAVLCASSLHYLTHPEAILSEIRRVLKTGGVLIISFTDRYMESKAIEAWKRRAGTIARCDLLAQCIAAGGGLTPPERCVRQSPLAPLAQIAPLLRPLCGEDPFAALVSYKGAPPAGWAVRLHTPEPVRIPGLNVRVAPLQLTPFAAMYLMYTLFHLL